VRSGAKHLIGSHKIPSWFRRLSISGFWHIHISIYRPFQIGNCPAGSLCNVTATRPTIAKSRDSRPWAHISCDVKICELIQTESGTETFRRVTKIVEGVPAVSVQRFRRISKNPDFVSKRESKPGDRFEVPFKYQPTTSTPADNCPSAHISGDFQI
jgi:hypothetical protein